MGICSQRFLMDGGMGRNNGYHSPLGQRQDADTGAAAGSRLLSTLAGKAGGYERQGFPRENNYSLRGRHRTGCHQQYDLGVVVKVRKWLCKLVGDRQGQALVEMALVLPILLLLFMGIFEFGRIMSATLIISDLARDGVRHGVVGYSDQSIKDLVEDRRAWLETDRLQVEISPSALNREKGDPLEVRVQYSLPLVAPFLSSLLPNPFPLESQCIMRIE